jgi:hypothetical protein
MPVPKLAAWDYGRAGTPVASSAAGICQSMHPTLLGDFPMSRREQRQKDRLRPRKSRNKLPHRPGKIRYGLAAWLLGLPLPFILLALAWGGCDF